jgi:hypothetical protein
MDRSTAFFDANVLYPAPLRNLLMRMALRDLFRAQWSRTVHDEWIEAALRDRPKLDRKKLERTRALMDAHVRDCLVEGYEELIEGLALPDLGDRHVLAAAIRGRADVIITMNLKDFPAGTLAPYGIEAQHPDTFIMHLIGMDVVAAAREHRASLRSPPKTVQAYLDSLARQGLTQTVASLRTFEDVL